MKNWMKSVGPARVVVLLAAFAANVRSQSRSGIGGIQGDADAPYAIGLWGDLPYSTVQETIGLPNLIADMNSQQLAFTVHDGDLKQGNGAPICDDALYLRALGWFNSLESPAIFTPTLGQRTFEQEVQATPLCKGIAGDEPCVENRRWTYGRVTYATLNVQGSCNNRCDTAPSDEEWLPGTQRTSPG